MKLTAVKCNKCSDIIYSRANHDMRYCSCGACAIDGGQNNRYFRTLGDCISVDLEIKNIDLKILYHDWNYSRNKYGLIKASKLEKELLKKKSNEE